MRPDPRVGPGTRWARHLWNATFVAGCRLPAPFALPAAAQTKRGLLIGIQHIRSQGSDISKPAGVRAERRGRRGPVGFFRNGATLDGSLNDVQSVHKASRQLKLDLQKQLSHIIGRGRKGHARRSSSRLWRSICWTSRGAAIPSHFVLRRTRLTALQLAHRQDRFHLDETIVPADAASGAFDIRDKEIARLCNQVVDKGILLTAIFDSCHSGSIARGFPGRRAGQSAVSAL